LLLVVAVRFIPLEVGLVKEVVVRGRKLPRPGWLKVLFLAETP